MSGQVEHSTARTIMESAQDNSGAWLRTPHLAEASSWQEAMPPRTSGHDVIEKLMPTSSLYLLQ